MVSDEAIVLRTIGFVKTDAVGDEVRDKTRISRIVVCEDLLEALDGIAGFSHIFVLYYLDKILGPQPLKVHPRGREDLPLLGVFATRTNLRPNTVGLTLVELLKVEGNVLTVRGLDAFDGTPVLDVKPYDWWDKAENAHVPEWRYQLEREKQKAEVTR
jgi:tRNA-Thr(GGU) m(6)t(6)A37 methyltransferase TsaA